MRTYRSGEADGIADPADGERVALETVVVEAVDASSDDWNLVLLGQGQELGDDVGIVERHLIIDEEAATGDLDAVEVEFGGEGNGFRFGGETQVPIGDPDRDFGGGSDERRG